MFIECLGSAFGVLQVPKEDVRAAGEDLAVVLEPQLGARDHPSGRPDAKGVRCREGQRPGVLALAVDLVNRHAERDEEVVGRSRGRSGGDGADASRVEAELSLDLRQHESIGQVVEKRRPPALLPGLSGPHRLLAGPGGDAPLVLGSC